MTDMERGVAGWHGLHDTSCTVITYLHHISPVTHLGKIIILCKRFDRHLDPSSRKLYFRFAKIRSMEDKVKKHNCLCLQYLSPWIQLSVFLVAWLLGCFMSLTLAIAHARVSQVSFRVRQQLVHTEGELTDLHNNRVIGLHWIGDTRSIY